MYLILKMYLGSFSASEVTTLRRYTNLFIIIIINILKISKHWSQSTVWSAERPEASFPTYALDMIQAAQRDEVPCTCHTRYMLSLTNNSTI